MFLDVLYLQKIYIYIYLASSQTFLSYPSVNESSRRWRRGKVWKKTVARDCTILFDLCSQPNETRILQIAFRHPPLPLHLLEIWEIFVPTPNTPLFLPFYSFQLEIIHYVESTHHPSNRKIFEKFSTRRGYNLV